MISHTPDNKQETRLPNTGATGNYHKYDVPLRPSTKMVQPIFTGFPNGKTMQ